MDFGSIPIVSLRLEGMKANIMSLLGVTGSELGEEIDKRINDAVASYDFDGVVSRTVHDAITKTIEGFFKYGEGNNYIRDAVNSALNKSFANHGTTTPHPPK